MDTCHDCGREIADNIHDHSHCPVCRFKRAILGITISQPLPSSLDRITQISEDAGMYEKTAEPKRTR